MSKEPDDQRKNAARMARYLGCSGTHQHDDGTWMPCRSHEELVRLSNRGEPKKKTAFVARGPEKRRRRRRIGRNVPGWEPLEESGVVGIDTLPGGGLVSAAISSKCLLNAVDSRPQFDGERVFFDVDEARVAAKSAGGYGVARRFTAEGDVVWVVLGGGDESQRLMRRIDDGFDEKAIGRAVRRTLGSMFRGGRGKRKLRRAPFVPDDQVEDADGDGIVQEGTIHQRTRRAKPDVTLGGSEVAAFAKKKPNKKKPQGGNPANKAKTGFLRGRPRQEGVIAQHDWMKPYFYVKPRNRQRHFGTAKQLAEKKDQYLDMIFYKYAEVQTVQDGLKALKKAYPNVKEITIPFGKECTGPIKEACDLDEYEQALIYTLLHLAETYPEAAKGWEALEAKPPQGGALAGSAFCPISGTVQNINGDGMDLEFQRNLEIYMGDKSVRELAADWEKVFNPNDDFFLPAKFGASYPDKGERRQMVIAHTLTHEFGHIWHSTILHEAATQKTNNLFEYFSILSGSDKQNLIALYNYIFQDVLQNNSDKSPSWIIREATTLFIRSMNRSSLAITELRESFGVNGGPQGLTHDALDYDDVMFEAQDLSVYAQTDIAEAVAEWFSAVNLFGANVPLNVDQSGNPAGSPTNGIGKLISLVPGFKSLKTFMDIRTKTKAQPMQPQPTRSDIESLLKELEKPDGFSLSGCTGMSPNMFTPDERNNQEEVS